MKVLNINKITTFVITYSFFINNHAFSSKNRLAGESFMSTSVTSKSLLVAGKSLSVIILSPLLKESSLTLDIFKLDKFVKEKYDCYILIIVTEMTVSKTNLFHRECTKIKSGPFFWKRGTSVSNSYKKPQSKQSYKFADTFSRTIS